MNEIRCKNPACKAIVARERDGGIVCAGATIRQPVDLICDACKRQRHWRPAKKPLRQKEKVVELGL